MATTVFDAHARVPRRNPHLRREVGLDRAGARGRRPRSRMWARRERDGRELDARRALATPFGVRLRDLGSKNGTYVGDPRSSRCSSITRPRSRWVAPSCSSRQRRRRRSICRHRAIRPDLHGSERGDARSSGASRRPLLRAHGAHSGRDRHRQGARRAGRARGVTAEEGPVRGRRLRRDRGLARGGDPLRPRARRVHRSADGASLALRGGERRHHLFDELGELPSTSSRSSSAALAEKRIKPVGSNTYILFDARVVAATRRDPKARSTAGVPQRPLLPPRAGPRVRPRAAPAPLEDIPGLVRVMLEQLGSKGAWRRHARDARSPAPLRLARQRTRAEECRSPSRSRWPTRTRPSTSRGGRPEDGQADEGQSRSTRAQCAATTTRSATPACVRALVLRTAR